MLILVERNDWRGVKSMTYRFGQGGGYACRDVGGSERLREVDGTGDGVMAAFDKAAKARAASAAPELCGARSAPRGERRLEGCPKEAQAFGFDRRG